MKKRRNLNSIRSKLAKEIAQFGDFFITIGTTLNFTKKLSLVWGSDRLGSEELNQVRSNPNKYIILKVELKKRSDKKFHDLGAVGAMLDYLHEHFEAMLPIVRGYVYSDKLSTQCVKELSTGPNMGVWLFATDGTYELRPMTLQELTSIVEKYDIGGLSCGIYNLYVIIPCE